MRNRSLGLIRRSVVVATTVLLSCVPTASRYSLSILVIPAGGGTVEVDPHAADYAAGELVTLTAVASPGYVFVRYHGDLSASTATVTFPMERTMEVEVYFEAAVSERYTLEVSVSPEGGGTVEVDPHAADYAAGELVTLTAVASPGYHFVAWQGDATGNDPVLALTMDADAAVQALFEVTEPSAFTGDNNRALLAGSAVGRATDDNSLLCKAISVTREDGVDGLEVVDAYAVRSWTVYDDGGVVLRVVNTSDESMGWVFVYAELRDSTGALITGAGDPEDAFLTGSVFRDPEGFFGASGLAPGESGYLFFQPPPSVAWSAMHEVRLLSVELSTPVQDPGSSVLPTAYAYDAGTYTLTVTVENSGTVAAQLDATIATYAFLLDDSSRPIYWCILNYPEAHSGRLEPGESVDVAGTVLTFGTASKVEVFTVFEVP